MLSGGTFEYRRTLSAPEEWRDRRVQHASDLQIAILSGCHPLVELRNRHAMGAAHEHGLLDASDVRVVAGTANQGGEPMIAVPQRRRLNINTGRFGACPGPCVAADLVPPLTSSSHGEQCSTSPGSQRVPVAISRAPGRCSALRSS